MIPANFLRCTFAGNSTTGLGGAIYTDQYLYLIHCTLSDNTAAGGGGGIALPGSPRYPYLYLQYSIVAGNHAPAAAEEDIFKLNGTIQRTASLIGIGTHAILPPGPFTGSAEAPLDGRLAPLGDYGGPTHTMPPALYSIARNAAAGSPSYIDQRGVPATGDPDIGAYETGGMDTYTAWSAERLPPDATAAQRAGSFDYDGDGETNEDEWINGTYPALAASRFEVTVTKSAGILRFTFPASEGRLYRLHTSRDLHNWTPAPSVPPVSGFDDPMELSIPEETGPRFFYKVVPELP